MQQRAFFAESAFPSVAGLAVLLDEGLAVNALANGRVRLVSCYADGIESAVVLIAAVILALLYRAFDAGVRSFVFLYSVYLYLFGF